MSICEDEAGNHMLQVVQSSAAQSGTELGTGKPDVLAGTAAVKSHHGTNFRGIKHPCDSKHALSHLSRVAYSPIAPRSDTKMIFCVWENKGVLFRNTVEDGGLAAPHAMPSSRGTSCCSSPLSEPITTPTTSESCASQ